MSNLIVHANLAEDHARAVIRDLEKVREALVNSINPDDGMKNLDKLTLLFDIDEQIKSLVWFPRLAERIRRLA